MLSDEMQQFIDTHYTEDAPMKDWIVKVAQLETSLDATHKVMVQRGELAIELEADNERLREREKTYCCIHKYLAENWPESLEGGDDEETYK